MPRAAPKPLRTHGILNDALSGLATSALAPELADFCDLIATSGPGAAIATITSASAATALPILGYVGILGGTLWLRGRREAKRDARRDKELRDHFKEIANLIRTAQTDLAAARDALEAIHQRRSHVWARIDNRDQVAIARRIRRDVAEVLEERNLATDQTLEDLAHLGFDSNARLRTLQADHQRILEELAIIRAAIERFARTSREQALPHQLRQPPVAFIGRDTQIDDILSGLGDGVALHAVDGMGGVGKTALALLLADEIADDYRGPHLQIDLRGAAEGDQQPLSPADATTALIRALDPHANTPEDAAQLEAQYRATLSEYPPGILLLDNALDAAQLRRLLPPNGWIALITSRRKLALPDRAITSRNVEMLSDEEALQLLAEIVGDDRDVTPDQATTLIRLCANLPLAIELVAASLAVHDDIPTESYIDSLRDENTRMERMERDESDPRRKLSASIAMSLRLLDTDQLERFLALSIFPPGADFDAFAAAATWDLTTTDDEGDTVPDAPAALTHLSDLRALSLLQWNESTHRYRLHDLIRLAARPRLDPTSRNPVERRFAAHYAYLAAAVDDLFVKHGEDSLRALAILDAERPNIDAAFALIEPRIRAGDHAAAETCRTLVGSTWHLTHIRLHPTELIRWLECYRAAARLLDDPVDEAIALGNLGLIMETRGDLDGAEATFRELLKVHEKLDSLEDMAKDYGNLGLVLQTRGDFDGAEAMHRKALEISEQLGRLEGMANQYGNLGVILRHRGDLDGAEAMHRKSLEIEEKLGRLEGMANQYGSLGLILEARGDLDGAEAMFRRSLEIDEQLGRLEGLVRTYGNLGLILRARGDLDGAESMHRKALEFNETLGRLEGMAIQHANLGAVMQARGNIPAARELWTRARDLFQKLGAPHQVAKVQSALDNLPD